PPIKLTVTGLGVSTIALQSGQPFGYLLMAPAFMADEGSQLLAGPGDLIRFANPAADEAPFEAALAQLPGVAPDLSNLGIIPADGFNQQVQASIHPQAQGWLIIAAVAALAGVVVVGQAFRRQLAAGSERLQALRALGMTPAELTAQGLVVAALVGVAGAAGALLIAYALSPLAPIGIARVAEPNPGLRFDALVLVGGGALLAVVSFLLGALAARWQVARLRPTARRGAALLQRRPSLITRWLGRAGASPSALIGSRYALETGGGPASSGTAILGTTVGVIAVVAAVLFAASLSHLLASPSLYGNAFAVQGGPNSQAPVSDQQFAAVLSTVAALPGIDQISVGSDGEVQVGKQALSAVAVEAVRGPLAVTVTGGRYPQAPTEVALGAGTMRALHAHIGSVVPVSAGPSTVAMRVVGQVVLPVTAGVGNGGLGDGVALSVPGLEALSCPVGTPASSCLFSAQVVFASFAHTAAGTAGYRQALSAANDPSSPFAFFLPFSPETLVNFGQAINFPLLVASIVVLFGAASLAHLLVVGLSRRRREVGTLKSIGFVRRQVAAMVGWQSATVMAVALVIGIPLGIVVGRAVWDAFTAYVGVETFSVLPWAGVGLIVAGGLAIAELIAAVPGIAASRRSAAALLRTEA
ncbi:MAG: FtsX-like permease family protein, partial [Actinomycetota bacterium]